MISHAVRKDEYDMVLALEVPIIKLKRTCNIPSFLTWRGCFYTDRTNLLNILIEWFPNPEPVEQQTKVFKSYKKMMCLGTHHFFIQKNMLMGRISPIKFFLSF